MRLSEKPLDVWVTCKDEGIVLAAHCTCIAGLGEVCSHVGSILYAVMTIVRSAKEVHTGID